MGAQNTCCIYPVPAVDSKTQSLTSRDLQCESSPDVRTCNGDAKMSSKFANRRHNARASRPPERGWRRPEQDIPGAHGLSGTGEAAGDNN